MMITTIMIPPTRAAFFLFGLAMLSAGFANAASVPISEQITNGTFDAGGSPSLSGWSASGTANARPVSDPINDGGTISDNAGSFDMGADPYFSSGPFAVLGDTQDAIPGAPNSGISSLSQNFTLPSAISGDAVTEYELDISFQTAFDGSGATGDIFKAELIDGGTTLLFSQTWSSSQANNNPFMSTLSNLAPGTYTLIFTLTELGGGGTANSAAGIDNVSVTGTATVVPTPPALWLMGAALLALGRLRKRAD